MPKKIEIFTDGACRGNPGPGGWAALLVFNGIEKEIYGGELETTNNRMELTAAIMGIESLKSPCEIMITTDSKYVMDGINKWMKDWKKRNWMTASKKPVKNKDLWQRLDRVCSTHTIEWYWVKGHSGHEENERVDLLANKGIDELTA